MKVENKSCPCILTVLCGTPDNLVEKQFYATYYDFGWDRKQEVIHLNGFRFARRRNNSKFNPWLTDNNYSAREDLYYLGYLYWNGVVYENFVISVQSIFVIPDYPYGFDLELTLCDLIRNISSLDDYFLFCDHPTYNGRDRDEVERLHLDKCIEYIKTTEPYHKTLIENWNGSDFVA